MTAPKHNVTSKMSTLKYLAARANTSNVKVICADDGFWLVQLHQNNIC